MAPGRPNAAAKPAATKTKQTNGSQPTATPKHTQTRSAKAGLMVRTTAAGV